MTEQEWEETYRKTERKLKKAVEIISCVIAMALMIVAVLWGRFTYNMEYKITNVSVMTSPDGKQEMTLQTVGEAEWTFEKSFLAIMDAACRPLTLESVGSISEAYRQAAEYAAQADCWLTGGVNGTPAGSYLLYDMDGNGRLELITNLNQGTGRYSENHFYSIAEKGEAVELPLVRLCAGMEKEWITDFDLTWEYMEAYQDESGVIYYEGNDFTREGVFGGYDETGFYYLKEGTVYQDSIRMCSRFTCSGEEEAEIHYYGIAVGDRVEQEEITEEEYAAIRENYVKDMSAVRVYQNWVWFTQDELAVGKMSPEFIARRLLESFLGSRCLEVPTMHNINEN